MTALLDRYWDEYGIKKKSSDREHSVLEAFGRSWAACSSREVDGRAVDRWYQGLTSKRGLSEGTAVRHFNVMHHMMEKAASIWSKETGIDRNPADLVEVKRPDARTGNTAREIWKLMEPEAGDRKQQAGS